MTFGSAVTLFCLCVCLPATPGHADSVAPQSISLQEYPGRLTRLHSLVDACMRNITPAACDQASVGPDAAVRTPEGIRIVQLAWLRSVLENAAAATREPAATKQNALQAALAGLRDAALQLDQQLSQQQQGHRGTRTVVSERAALHNILTTGGYAQEIPPTLFEKIQDAFRRWLEERLNAMGANPGSQLLVDLLLITLILAICGGMAAWLARKVRSQSLFLLPTQTPHPSAPSTQDWQAWLEQGRSFAQKQQWREAIHHVYWSAISRLESRGLWPADRARTPREYLTLLNGRPETSADLHALTRSFERTWYGDLAAGQPEFDDACALLERLVR